jgi:hypothetical protein
LSSSDDDEISSAIRAAEEDLRRTYELKYKKKSEKRRLRETLKSTALGSRTQGSILAVQDEVEEVMEDHPALINKEGVEDGQRYSGANNTTGAHIMGADEGKNPVLVQKNRSKTGDGGLNIESGAEQAVHVFYHFLHISTHNQLKKITHQNSHKVPLDMSHADIKIMMASMANSVNKSALGASLSGLCLALMHRLSRAPSHDELQALISLSSDAILGYEDMKELESAQGSNSIHEALISRAINYRHELGN